MLPYQIERYSRQMLLPQVGPDAQKRIIASSVLVVGAGGLGCPVILFLAGAGVGTLTIVDCDTVDVSNLHRQIAHTEDRAGMNKAESAKAAALALNSTIVVHAVAEKFSSENGLALASRHDLVVDATDNPGTRYLINDACVLAGKPLVSGAALGLNGQLSVYNLNGGPCYRCVFPEPPPRASFVSCSDGGVMGPVPGLIASQQAMEALKILGKFGSPLTQRLLVYDAEECTFRVMKLRPRSPTCAVCGDTPTITTLAQTDAFCASLDVPCVEVCPVARTDAAAVALSVPSTRLHDVITGNTPHVILDVRVPVQFGMCSLGGSINIPLSQLHMRLHEVDDAVANAAAVSPFLGSREASEGAVGEGGEEGAHSTSNKNAQVFVVCRRGIDSLRAVELLRDAGYTNAYNISGGLDAWRREVDPTFPKY